ncbi:unnamed protein product [Miscanthus lutarioriparius]|uniref:Uncharacterized protein n=1 Tax=Miscanthus lutarioriparius TaxID=422564 RepID=A0A811NFS8_9POAL|nr:unnamed protein product [Miscanthus lutarioriparius]
MDQMTRWDEILTLPVQNPPSLEFSAADISWSMVEGWKDSMDRLALIPYSRVNDFVRGESNNKDCPTRFHVEARRRRPPTMNCKPKVDGILEYILYWCSFGPDDYRKGGNVRPSRPISEKRKTPAGRPNTKRGCVCHFIVKRLIVEPSVALVIYNHNKHVDKKGMPCHGSMDKMAVGTKAMFAPYISDELRLQVMSLLYVGIPVETIMQRHTEIVEKQGGPSNRDDLLTHRYVRRLERKIRRSVYELDDDDTISIDLWVENNQDYVFFYEDFSDTDTFVLGIQTDWQLQQMIQFGSHSLMASDSKFGTNKLKYPVHSILVFDQHKNAIPVAWIITPNFAHGEIHKWMGALYDRAHTKDPTWHLGGFIIDDPLADVHTIREVFHCPVLISLWRIRHAWHKNLVNKCSDIEKRSAMAKRLGDAISSICRGNGDVELFEGFLQDFIDCAGFLDYFEARWLPRLGAWITVLKATSLATAQVASAIESYHHLLKLRLLNEADKSVYWRADWLVHKLGTKVHSYYWLDEFSGKNSFSRYWRSEWSSGPNPWCQGMQISDSNVVIEGNYASVVSQKNKEKSHVVLNPGQLSRIHNQRVSQENLKLRKPTLRMVCASQSQPGAGDNEDQDIPTGKKRKSGNASGDSEDVSIYQDSLASKKHKSGEASGDDEEASTEEDSRARESRKTGGTSANDKEVSAGQDSRDREKRKLGEPSGNEGTSATQAMQPSETETSQATNGLNNDKLRLAEGAIGT